GLNVVGLDALSLPVPLSSAGTPTGVDTTIRTGLVGTPNSPNSGFGGAQPGYDAAHNAYLIGQVTFTTTATAGNGTTLSVKNSTSNTSPSSAIGKSNSTGNAGPPPAFNTSYTDLSGNFSQVSAGVFANATINVTGGRNGDFTGPTPGTPDG